MDAGHLHGYPQQVNIEVMQRTERIKTRLAAEFKPRQLNVIDESEAHRGHGGWREGGGTHIAVEIAGDAFKNKSRLAAHRMVNAALKDELENGLHALRITILT